MGTKIKNIKEGSKDGPWDTQHFKGGETEEWQAEKEEGIKARMRSEMPREGATPSLRQEE